MEPKEQLWAVSKAKALKRTPTNKLNEFRGSNSRHNAWSQFVSVITSQNKQVATIYMVNVWMILHKVVRIQLSSLWSSSFLICSSWFCTCNVLMSDSRASKSIEEFWIVILQLQTWASNCMIQEVNAFLDETSAEWDGTDKDPTALWTGGNDDCWLLQDGEWMVLIDQIILTLKLVSLAGYHLQWCMDSMAVGFWAVNKKQGNHKLNDLTFLCMASIDSQPFDWMHYFVR